MAVAERRTPGRASAATGGLGGAQPHPAQLAAQRWPGRSRPPKSRTHPRLAEHRRREERKYIDDRVPPELAQLLLQFDASILVDRTWGEVAGRCAAAATNLLGLHLVHALVTGNPSVEEARHHGAEHRALPGPRRALCRAAAVRGPQGGTEDLAGSKGAVERCSSSWRAGARTRSPAARKRPIVAPPGCARRAGWSRNLAKGFQPASVAAVPRSAARFGVILEGSRPWLHDADGRSRWAY